MDQDREQHGAARAAADQEEGAAVRVSTQRRMQSLRFRENEELRELEVGEGRAKRKGRPQHVPEALLKGLAHRYTIDEYNETAILPVIKRALTIHSGSGNWTEAQYTEEVSCVRYSSPCPPCCLQPPDPMPGG
jgi:hypothetical protein